MIVGILGGGQLARMMALAGYPLGFEFIVIDPARDACAGTVAEHWANAYDDRAVLEALCKRADVVTYEFENVAATSVRHIADHVPVYPPPRALETSADRLLEKNLFTALGIPTPPFHAVDSLADLGLALDALGVPAVLKTRREGYDGKGQFVITRRDMAQAAWSALPGGPKILEQFVVFEREVSALAVRSRGGDIAHYDLAENIHRDGILRRTTTRPNDPMTPAARDYVTRLLVEFDYVGVIALELFATPGGLVANEFAPRVHNSGHWTIEGARTSQFENHLRAIMDLPLGATGGRGHCAMLNFIGDLPSLEDVLAQSGAHVHVYGKAARPGRKVGHVTLCAESGDELDRALAILSVLADAGR